MAYWKFNPNEYEEKEFNYELIPEGDYRARIEEVIEKTFKSGNEGFEITLKINGYDSKVWYYLVLNPADTKATNQRLGTFFKCFGIQSTDVQDFRMWHGQVGGVRIVHEEYNGNKNAKVKYLISKENQAKLPAWEGAAPVEVVDDGDLPF